MIELLKRIESTNRKYGLFNPGDRILIALSGGPDSVALLHLMNLLSPDYNLTLAAAHVNHKLRRSADTDMRFCRELCRVHAIKFHSRSIEMRKLAARIKTGVEQTGREYRYSFFQKLCSKYGYTKIATGHTADDNAETFMLNLIRGADLAGLGGIAARRDNIIRPLIELTKKELLLFLDGHGLSFRIDKSNLSLEYNRNVIRNRILPLLDSINPAASSHIARAAGSFRESYRIIQAEVDKAYGSCVVNRSNREIILDLKKLAFYDKSLESWIMVRAYFELTGAFRRPGSAKIEKALALKRGGSIAFLDNGIMVARHKESLILSQPSRPIKRTILKRNKKNSLGGSDFKIKADVINDFDLAEILNNKDESIAYLDNDKVTRPEVRGLKKGDKFRPLGMKGTKKLADYFNDKAVSSDLKKSVPIVVSEGRIVWVAGCGIADEFKVTDRTRQVLRLHLTGR